MSSRNIQQQTTRDDEHRTAAEPSAATTSSSSSSSFPSSSSISSSVSSSNTTQTAASITPLGPECAVCLQSCLYPVQLPCQHTFCFLCIKGAAHYSRRCAICRAEFPVHFLEQQTKVDDDDVVNGGACSGHRNGVDARRLGSSSQHSASITWFYEGRCGWWQYDERSSVEIESNYSQGRPSVELLIAGNLYLIDLREMCQYRHNDRSIRRRIRRAPANISDKIGVAGLRLTSTSSTKSSTAAATAAGSDNNIEADVATLSLHDDYDDDSVNNRGSST